MGDVEGRVLENLIPIFPNLSRETLSRYVRNLQYHAAPLDEALLLNRCIDQALLDQQPDNDIPVVDLANEASPEPCRVFHTIDLVNPKAPANPTVIDGGFIGDDDFEGIDNAVRIDKSGNVTSLKRKETISSSDLPDLPPVKKRLSASKKVRKSPTKAWPRADSVPSVTPLQEESAGNHHNPLLDVKQDRRTQSKPGPSNQSNAKEAQGTMNNDYNMLYNPAIGDELDSILRDLDIPDYIVPPPLPSRPVELAPTFTFAPPLQSNIVHRATSEAQGYNIAAATAATAGAHVTAAATVTATTITALHEDPEVHHIEEVPRQNINPAPQYIPPPYPMFPQPPQYDNPPQPQYAQERQQYAQERLEYAQERQQYAQERQQYAQERQRYAQEHYTQEQPHYAQEQPQYAPEQPVDVPPLDPHLHEPQQHTLGMDNIVDLVGADNGVNNDVNNQVNNGVNNNVNNGVNGANNGADNPVEDELDRDAQQVMDMFPDIDPDFIISKLFATPHDRVASTVNYILENPGECRKKVKAGPSGESSETAKSSAGRKKKASGKNYYEELATELGREYIDHGYHLLSQEFNRLAKRDIDRVFHWFKFNYAPTRKCLEDALTRHGITLEFEEPTANHPNLHHSLTNGKSKVPIGVIKVEAKHPKLNGTLTTNMCLLKCVRPKKGASNFKTLNKEIKKELKFIRTYDISKTEEQDSAMAASMNEEEYLEEGQGIECGCCFGCCPFERMVQCMDSHLFCMACLRGYAKEAIYGQGKAELKCMSDGCSAGYSKSELQRCLPEDMMEKYEDRVQQEALNMAAMDDLCRCPHCDFAAIVPPGNKVLQCQQPECLKETCRHCKEDWEHHIGIPCHELEKKDDTKTRLAYEEKMTQAMLRTCYKCKASFTKSEGCNKMTCRCGSKMCYICREPAIDYKHFCQHPREPGKGCDKCTACSLWSDPSEDEKQAIREIQKEAEQERIKKGFSADKAQIGAPDEPAPKKKKT